MLARPKLRLSRRLKALQPSVIDFRLHLRLLHSDDAPLFVLAVFVSTICTPHACHFFLRHTWNEVTAITQNQKHRAWWAPSAAQSKKGRSTASAHQREDKSGHERLHVGLGEEARSPGSCTSTRAVRLKPEKLNPNPP